MEDNLVESNGYEDDNNRKNFVTLQHVKLEDNQYEEQQNDSCYDDYLQICIEDADDYKSDGCKTEHLSHSPSKGPRPKTQKRDHRFICEYCPKSFAMRSNLVVHVRTHTQERPFICQICGKSFSAKGNLNTHLLSHSEERPFVCHLCSKGFTTKGNLQVHMRSHNKEKPYPCDVCGKSFSTKGNLTTHSNSHKLIKPYQCLVCQKQFSTNHNLTIHRRTHTKEKPFECQFCEKTFYSKGVLSSHIKQRHPNESAETLIERSISDTIDSIMKNASDICKSEPMSSSETSNVDHLIANNSF